jgi:hypothetical protein
MGGDKLTVLTAAVGENVLNKVIAKLVTSNCSHVSDHGTPTLGV